MGSAWAGAMWRMSLAFGVAVALAIGAPTAASALEPGDLVVSDFSAFGDGEGGLIGVTPDGTRSTVSENAAPAGAPNFNGPGPVVFDADGDLLMTNGNALLRVDPDTGVRTTISSASVGSGPAFGGPWGLAIEPGGDILVINSGNESVLRVNPTSGDRTVVSSNDHGTGPTFVDPFGIAIEADGDLLVLDEFAPDGEGGVIRIDPVTGDRTAVSSNAIGTGPDFDDPFSLALEADGDILVANFVGDGPERTVLRVDPVSGDRETVTSSSVGDGPGIGTIGGITVEPGGDILLANQDSLDGTAAAESSGVLRVDPESGDRTTVSDNLTPGGEPEFVFPYGIAIVPEEETPPYSDVVLGDTPAGYWRFGETTGPTALDSSGNGNNGTYLGLPQLQVPGALAGDLNKAVRMDGINDTVRVPDTNTLDVGNTFTAEGWIKRTATTKVHELMNKSFQLSVMGAANGNQVFLRKPNVSTIARTTGGIGTGAYHHIAVTKNGSGTGSVKFYIDGALAPSVAVSLAQVIVDNNTLLTFGAAGSTSADYDEFALYDSVLSAAQIQAHYDAGAPAM
jgi:hypothetical protein